MASMLLPDVSGGGCGKGLVCVRERAGWAEPRDTIYEYTICACLCGVVPTTDRLVTVAMRDQSAGAVSGCGPLYRA